MRLAILAFAAGVLILQWQAELPAAGWLVAAAAGGLALFAAARRWPWFSVPAALLLGFAWAGGWAMLRLADALPAAHEGRDIELVGVVASLPQAFENGVRFEFDVERSSLAAPKRIALSWYHGFRPQEDDDFHILPRLRAGERWQLTVRLRRPHGNVNPHGFDYEGWLFERGLRATGYVRKSGENRRLDDLVIAPGYLVERAREAVRERFRRALGEASYAGVLVALAIGDQRAIEPELWRVFSRTGTTHLMSISGLHVTMVAGLAAGLAGWAWRRLPRLVLRLPAQKAAAAMGFLAAFAYCLLAGFAVPAQRTLYMLAVVALALGSGRAIAGSRVLAAALLVVLLLDPWAVLAPGFWLSFGAVGVLFYAGAGRLRAGHWLTEWARAQWAVTLGLIPALLALFQQFSLVSPLANAVAIPVVSLLVTPLVLLATLPFAAPLLHLAHWLTDALMRFLVWLSATGWAVWQQPAPPAWAVALGVAGVAWMLLPRGFPARWVGAVALVPLVALPVARPPEGELLVRMLDVGQGLAVHVQTANHDLLYDAGPAYSADADAGSRVVVPYLRAIGVARLDMLVVSHRDKDHEGGAASVLKEVPTGELLTSVADDHPLGAVPVPRRRCSDGQSWAWDGVRFEVLHPEEADYGRSRKSNALSCVLKVSAPGGALLLTGDIEAKEEAALVARHGGRLAADVLLPPHHGSRSSSSAEFIAGVSPRLSLVSAGYRNRFGHPSPEVVERLRNSAVVMRRTDAEGALTLRFGPAGIAVAAARDERRRYWHAR